MTGQAVARVNGMSPDVPVPAGRNGFKAELDSLRERMRAVGSVLTRSRPETDIRGNCGPS